MKRKSLLFLSLLISVSAQAQQLPHLDPEMTGAEYRSIFTAMEKTAGFSNRVAADPLNKILKLGKRNLDWIEAINKLRDDEHKLQLTTAETTTAHPIDTPAYSNRTIITGDLAKLQSSMPKVMADVIFGTQSLPDTAPLDDQTFLANAREMNRIYEAASRWLLEEPYLDQYEEFAASDIRGYYFLNKETDLENKLDHWANLDADTQKKYSDWLAGECLNNTDNVDQCQKDLQKAIKNNTVGAYHNAYVPQAQHIYNAFFELQNPRPEIVWNSSNPNVMQLPFTDPNNQDVRDWFKTNVEDEWRVNDWALKVDFETRNDLAKVEFEAGATPHVNGLGGDTITMDANRQLNEYIVTWTIRHEFGHVLGFPDCYVEFYDKKNAVMINYQIDITNLMCSRRGHLQTQHYDQLKKNYYKG